MTHPEIRAFITATADENEREFVDDFVALWSSNRVTFANLRDLLEAHDKYKDAIEKIACSGTSQPPGMNMPESTWYRCIAFDLIGIAAAARQQQAGDKT